MPCLIIQWLIGWMPSCYELALPFDAGSTSIVYVLCWPDAWDRSPPAGHGRSTTDRLMDPSIHADSLIRMKQGAMTELINIYIFKGITDCIDLPVVRDML